MGKITEAMSELADDSDGTRRVMKWAISAFLPEEVSPLANLGAWSPSPQTQVVNQSQQNARAPTSGDPLPTFNTIGDLYAVASPSGDADRALVVGYWLQVIKGENDLDGFMVNKQLKHLGHAVANITQAFGSLIARKPQLAIQTRKDGNSQQARKRYKLTMEGIRAVERMLRGESPI